MPGGIGTLHEIVAVWEFMRIGEIAPGPIVCYGPYWEEMLGPLLNHRYTHPDYLPLLRFAHTPAEVVQAVQSYSPESITWTRHS
jgi:predicted Rossmann-fold nucleotide-binding protein